VSLHSVPSLEALRRLSVDGSAQAVAMSEGDFLKLAKQRLQQPVGVLLDSAGPIMERAQKMLLSGQVLGAFCMEADGVYWWDAASSQQEPLELTVFRDWLEGFHQAGFPSGGPILFPLLTYEALKPWAKPQRPHPLWRDPLAIWVLCANHQVFDRENQQALLSSAKVCADLAPLQNLETDALLRSLHGWRESAGLYTEKIHLLQRDIYEGNFYQANLSQRYVGHTDHSPFEIYLNLRQRNPSPFMGIFRWGSRWVLSGSPERLLFKEGDFLSTRPIAGTKPRFADGQKDQASQQDLLTSPKERAEHLMLVDLLRNDLGRVAAAGSVHVDEFAVIESYSHVHHLVSEVSANLRDGVDVYELLCSVFPGGTITGAPKIACMQRLAELEEEARGPYTGSMGYIDSNGCLDFNILIRSLIFDRQHVCFHAGGGIVADSCHDSEYLETRYKAQALMETLGID
jgi:anthranilate/para-aminobenzoate synthase component I